MSRTMRSCTMLLHRHAFNHYRAQAATLHKERTRHRYAGPPMPPAGPSHQHDKGKSAMPHS